MGKEVVRQIAGWTMTIRRRTEQILTSPLYQQMMAGRSLIATRMRSCGLIGLFSMILVLSVFSVFTNVMLSMVLTTRGSGRLLSGIFLHSDARSRRADADSIMPGPTLEPPLGGVQGIMPGYRIEIGEHEWHGANETASVGLLSRNESLASPTQNATTGLMANTTNGSAIQTAPGSVGHPWWWVDFQVQNETFLREVDEFLLTNVEFTDFSLTVSLEDIDSLKVELPPLIPNTANPCWLELVPDSFSYESSLYRCHINYRRIRKSFAFLTELIQTRARTGAKWRLRCFPAFFLIGVAKCGTTDLYEAMTQHPDIITSELKEPEYWSRQRYGTNPWLFQTDCQGFKARATFADYLDTYDNASEAIRRSYVRDENGVLRSNVLFGDYSTHTMEELFFWDRSQDEPELITADHIHKLRPETKFIVILRDPVERAYSRYKMRFKNRGNVAGTTDDFHERMVKQVSGTEACLRMYKRRVCVYKENIGKAGDHTILVNGMYIVYLKDWLNVFPLEQFMIIRFEDYIQDRMTYIEKITDFLGLKPMPAPEREYIRNMPAANAGISLGGMKNETRTILQNFFSPFNHELVELTGNQNFTWDY